MKSDMCNASILTRLLTKRATCCSECTFGDLRNCVPATILELPQLSPGPNPEQPICFEHAQRSSSSKRRGTASAQFPSLACA